VLLDLLSDAEERNDLAMSAEASAAVDGGGGCAYRDRVYQYRELPQATKLGYAMTRTLERTGGAVYCGAVVMTKFTSI
jgi:hypothetical protein